jgi:hypothetical protein
MIESRWRLEDNVVESGNESECTISRIQTVKLHDADSDSFDRLALIRCRQLLLEGLDLQLMVEDDEPLDYDNLLK